MVKEKKYRYLLLAFLLIFIGCKSQELKNIKYFNHEQLKNISFNKTYLCVEMYEANSNLKRKRKIELNYNLYLKIKDDGYIEAINFASINKEGNSGVIYVKKVEIKIDLITLLSDTSPTIIIYNAKFIDGNLHLIEDRWIGGDSLS